MSKTFQKMVRFYRNFVLLDIYRIPRMHPPSRHGIGLRYAGQKDKASSFSNSPKVRLCSAVEGTPKGVQKCYAPALNLVAWLKSHQLCKGSARKTRVSLTVAYATLRFGYFLKIFIVRGSFSECVFRLGGTMETNPLCRRWIFKKHRRSGHNNVPRRLLFRARNTVFCA